MQRSIRACYQSIRPSLAALHGRSTGSVFIHGSASSLKKEDENKSSEKDSSKPSVSPIKLARQRIKDLRADGKSAANERLSKATGVLFYQSSTYHRASVLRKGPTRIKGMMKVMSAVM
jgi:hypothetical protein